MPASRPMDAPLVVTDSSACLPKTPLGSRDVRVLPISVQRVEGDKWEDPTPPHDLRAGLQAGEAMKSSPPTVLDYLEAIESSGCDSAVIITPAEEFTIMRRSAVAAASLADREVYVVDTRTAAAAQGLVVLAALHAVRQGRPAAAVADVARAASERADLVAVLDSVASLRRSGRVPATALEAAGATERVLFRFRNGSVLPLGGAHGLDDALSRLAQEWHDGGGEDGAHSWARHGFPHSLVFHASEELRARRLRQRLSGDLPVVAFSPAMALHTGPSCVGVAWLRPATP